MFLVKTSKYKLFTKKHKYDLFVYQLPLIQHILQIELKLQKYKIHDCKIMITKKLNERDFEQL